MYKFTNGVVVFTEEDKENYLKAGYVLVEEKKEKVVEEDNKDGSIAKEYKRSDTKSRKLYKSSK